MNIYSFLPLLATIIYIPLIISTAASRPLKSRHKLFIVFLVIAMMWSLADYIFHSVFLPQYDVLLIKVIVILFTATIVHFYLFASYFFPEGRGRWIPFAYFVLVLVIGMVAAGRIPEDFATYNGEIYPL